MFVSDRTSHLKINSKYFERRAQCDRRRHCRSVHLSPFSFSSPYSFFDSIFETKAINDSILRAPITANPYMEIC